jgi:hypothetical protein
VSSITIAEFFNGIFIVAEAVIKKTSATKHDTIIGTANFFINYLLLLDYSVL